MQPLIYTLINQLRLSSRSVLFIEFLSSSQIIHLFLKGIVNSTEANDQSMFLIFSKNIAFLSGAHDIIFSDTYNALVKPLWILCVCYFASLAVLTIALPFLKTRSGKARDYFLKSLGLIFLLHSRIISFPIQYFLLSLTEINYTENINISTFEVDMFYKEDGFVVVTALLIVVNSFFALTQEFVLYQISDSKNHYAVKTNLYHQIVLIYKSLGLILCFLGYKYLVITQISSVFHLLFVVSLLYVLYTKLPFYKFGVLRATIIFTGIFLPLSVVSIIQAFSTDRDVQKSLEIFLLFAPGVIIKMLFVRFQVLFKKILRGESKSPEYVIHSVLLLRDLITPDDKKWFASRDILKPNMNYSFGILANKEIKLTGLQNSETKKQYKAQIYDEIAEKLKEGFALYPNSKVFLIFKAHFHLTKLEQVGRALELIKRVESKSSSVPIRSAIAAFSSKLDRVYSKRYLASDTLKELRNYFTYNTIASSIKKNIREEIENQLEFWQDIHKGRLDVKKTIEKVEKIDSFSYKIQKQVQLHSTEFTTYCPNSLLMYSVYLHTIRQLPQEGVRMAKKYKMSLLHGSSREVLDMCSGTVCIAAISLDKQRIGQIIDVSGQTQDLFRVKKSELIGRNFSGLFPTIIARNYTNMLNQYLKGSRTNLDFKDRLSYGKLYNGDLFQLETHFQLYPYMNKELAVVVLLKKISNAKMVLIANHNGSIVDCSKSLEEHFLKESVNFDSTKNLYDLSTEFERINLAFNVISNRTYSVAKVPDEPSYSVMNGNSQIIPSIDDRTARSTIILAVQDTERQSLTRGALRTPRDTFMYSSTGIGLRTSMGSDMTRLLRLKTMNDNYKMSKKEAQKIVDKYMHGQKITLDCLVSNSNKKGVLTSDVQVKPYLIEGDVYKIITLAGLERGKSPVSRVGSESYKSRMEGDSSYESLLVDEFVVTARKPQQPAEPEDSPSNSDENPSASVVSFGALGHQDFRCSDEEAKKEVYDTKRMIENDEQGNSIMDAHYKETRVAQTLRSAWTKNKIHPLLKYSIIIVYLIIAGIILLTWLNHRFSKNSILELEKAITVVSTATLRVQDMLAVWQFGLILHQITVGLYYYPPYLIDIIKGATIARCLLATQHNNQLKNEVSNIQEQSLIDRAFLKDIKMWSASEPMGVDYQEVDSFFANNVLISKYLAFNAILGNGETMYNEEIDLLFKNTANDYMVTSLDIIAETGTLLQTIISRNMTSLKITLAFEILTLFLLLMIFALMSFVTLNSHKRLFRALSRTHETNILERLRDIKKVKTLLEEDIEMKIFCEKAFNILEDSKPKREAVKSAKYSKDQHFEMKYIKLYILGRVGLGSIFIPLFAALFATIFSNSQATFQRLENESYKISVLSQTTYQEDVFMNTLMYEMMYQNDTTMTFFNQPSRVQLIQNIERFKESNDKFSSISISQDGQTSDPIIETVLKNELCPFLDEVTQPPCAISMRGGKIGLLSIKAHILQASLDAIYLYLQNSTFESAKIIIASYNVAISSEVSTVHSAYIFLTGYMLDRFAEKVQESLQHDLLIYACLCAVIGIYIFYVHVVCLAKIKAVDLSRRKILKIIPTSTIQENRVISFYLIKDFGKEIEAIKNIL